eukprot:TRINITY_DN861_c0_g1_i5.p1 TRINITY_DN861_c0_g1~~TRINITY_DN861_c0_g1_i5.p1  ORF type:complete len:353 (+),score=62.01 TRINITY_DN861_c0_g1_i5:291-1349(+)
MLSGRTQQEQLGVKETSITLEVDSVLKDVSGEEFARYSSQVLSRKLQRYPVNLIPDMSEEAIIDSLGEFFRSACFAIIPQDQFMEQLPSLSIKMDLKNLAFFLHLSLANLPEDLEILFLRHIEDSPLKLLSIDLNNELQLYNISRPSNPNKAFADTLNQTIEMYERLLAKERANGQDTEHTEGLLKTLRAQLVNVGRKESREEAKEVKDPGKRKEKLMKGLDEVFHFYTKQLALAHVRKTFETVQKEKDTMTLGYYVRFLKDFAVEFDLKVRYRSEEVEAKKSIHEDSAFGAAAEFRKVRGVHREGRGHGAQGRHRQAAESQRREKTLAARHGETQSCRGTEANGRNRCERS